MRRNSFSPMFVAAATDFATGLKGRGWRCPPSFERRLLFQRRDGGQWLERCSPHGGCPPAPGPAEKQLSQILRASSARVCWDLCSHVCSPGGLGPVGLHSAPAGCLPASLNSSGQLLAASALSKQMSHPSSPSWLRSLSRFWLSRSP